VLAKSARDFHSAPLGAFTAGESWLYFAFERGPHGYSLWGTPSAEDMQRLAGVLENELVREPPHTGLVDLRHLEGVRPATFAVLERYTATHGARLREIVTHTAMVRPTGLVGVMAEGFFRIVKPPFELSYWTRIEDALERVGHPDPVHGAAELEQARATVTGRSPLMLKLATYLEKHLADPNIEEAARACGVSVRTLQRQLSVEATTFAREAMSLRIRRAKMLLHESDEPITALALGLGFATAQHFSEVFKREVGTTPNSFRARRS
jgi:AraC-like DNA-binding protein